MKPGERIRTITPIRSHRSGLMLPREAVFISATENIGRTLILVDFGAAGREYLLAHEIEAEEGNQNHHLEIQ
ncbi:MAG: hypothetical protein ACE5JU_24655 [Candidatus Binatia bacterium]